MTFWEHLDELRRRLGYAVLVALGATVLCFCFKETLFSVVLRPKPADMALINVELTQQFMIHLRVSFWGGLLVVLPYLLYQLFAFVAPGLYALERRATVRALGAGYLLFMSGVALNYFVVFPFTVRFLGHYQVSEEVANAITLGSYVSVLGVLSLLMGVVFELPVVCWLLGWVGVLKADFMRRYRRHALVGILIVGAVITPTGDPFTLALVSAPIYLLWEVGILVVRRVERRRGVAEMQATT